MELAQETLACRGIRFCLRDAKGEEIAHAYLYLMLNDLHPGQPFGLLEDVFVVEEHRHKGHGVRLIRYVIKEAETVGCYKLIATSRHGRPEVHDLYLRLGFADHGKEFRLDF